jgi:hypothetical protein
MNLSTPFILLLLHAFATATPIPSNHNVEASLKQDTFNGDIAKALTTSHPIIQLRHKIPSYLPSEFYGLFSRRSVEDSKIDIPTQKEVPDEDVDENMDNEESKWKIRDLWGLLNKEVMKGGLGWFGRRREWEMSSWD